MKYDKEKVTKRLLSIREELVLLDFVNKEMTKSVDNKLKEIDTPSLCSEFDRITKRGR